MDIYAIESFCERWIDFGFHWWCCGLMNCYEQSPAQKGGAAPLTSTLGFNENLAPQKSMGMVVRFRGCLAGLGSSRLDRLPQGQLANRAEAGGCNG
ncbi:MAG: hypothetical protein EKK49_05990 [Rhodocyclaceae bacterium]|nr:MAG: hypothetical protein EKK49_05990 [Rhodocyclaceae bacterium]